MGCSSHYSTKKPDPFRPKKQQLSLVLDYQSLNKSINATHNGNSWISYYHLPNIMDLLARLQKGTIFSSLDFRSGYLCIGLTPEAKPKNHFYHNKWLMAMKCGSFWYTFTTRCFLLSYVTGIGWISFLLCIPWWYTSLQYIVERTPAASWDCL